MIIVIGDRTVIVDLLNPNRTRIEGVKTSSFILDEVFNIKIEGIEASIEKIVEVAGCGPVEIEDIRNQLLENPFNPYSQSYSRFHVMVASGLANDLCKLNSMEEFEQRFELGLLTTINWFMQMRLARLVLSTEPEDIQHTIGCKVFMPEFYEQYGDTALKVCRSTNRDDQFYFPSELFLALDAETAMQSLCRVRKHSEKILEEKDRNFIACMLGAFFACHYEVINTHNDWKTLSNTDEEKFEEHQSTFLYAIAAKQKISELLRNFYSEKKRTFIERNSFKIVDRNYDGDQIAYKKEKLDEDYIIYHCVDGKKVEINPWVEFFVRYGCNDKQNPTTKTYVIFNPTTKLIKIGKSCEVEKRIKTLSTQSGCKLEVLHVFNDNRENKLHKRFADLRIYGEWFADDGQIRDYVNEQQEILK